MMKAGPELIDVTRIEAMSPWLSDPYARNAQYE
jgi:hypothetical protein